MNNSNTNIIIEILEQDLLIYHHQIQNHKDYKLKIYIHLKFNAK